MLVVHPIHHRWKLTRFSQSKLAKFFNGSLPIPVDPVKHQYFFDRDGKTFRHVLNFLRNSKLILPDNYGELKLLLEEAIYFEIEDLRKDIQQFMDNRIEKSEEVEEHDGNSTSSEAKSTTDENSSNSVKKNKKKKPKTKKSSKSIDKNIQGTTSETDEDNESSVVSPNYIDNNETTCCVDEKNNRGENQQTVCVKGKGMEENNLPSINVTTSNSSELACVVTNTFGGVKELWCSEENFNIEGLITLESSQFVGVEKCSTNSKFLLAKRFNFLSFIKCSYCNNFMKNLPTIYHNTPICSSCKREKRICGIPREVVEKDKSRVAFPRVSRFLFNNNYKLVTSLFVEDSLRLHHYFVKKPTTV